MKSPTIRVKRPADPLASEIQARLAKKKAASKREQVPASIVGPEALFDLSAYLRAHPVTVVIMEARP